MKTLRIYSDIHQEYRDEDSLFVVEKMEDEKNQILILPGDIDNLKNYKKDPKRKEWLRSLSERFYKTLYVFGNHEFYGDKIGSKYDIENISLFSDIENLHVLSRKTPSILIDDVMFVGATLWTNLYNINFLDPNIINDVKSIKSSGKRGFTKFNKDVWLDENRDDLEWIKSEIEKFKGKVVVVTHHAPILTQHPLDDEGRFTYHNSSDLTDLILKNKNIILWIHGHIHQKCVKIRKVGDTTVFSNTITPKKNKDKPIESLYFI